MSLVDELRDIGVVAVIRGASKEAALATCDALIEGGMRGIELPYSTPDCAAAIAELAGRAPAGVAVGVGTVRTVEQLQAAHDAGATFAVSPLFSETLMQKALDLGIPYLPGGITPTEIVRAFEAGAATVKLFPGSSVDPGFVKAIRAPLPDIPLMPTGGVSPDNMEQWFAAGVVAVGMGGNLAKGTPNEVRAAAQATAQRLKEIRG